MPVNRVLFALVTCLGVLAPARAFSQGIALNGVGAINRSFGGAAVASPIDAAGAMHWNPAAISGLDRSQAELSLELLLADTEVSSGIEALDAEGQTDSSEDASPIPVLALVLRQPDSPWTFGLGLFGVAGFGVRYAADPGNPITSPPPPEGGGFGKLVGEAQIIQAVPTAAYQWGDLSFGIAPVLTVARVRADPYFFGQPSSTGVYHSNSDADYVFGGGFQTGVFYRHPSGVQLGASYKITQWMEPLNENTTDENGLPRHEEIDLDYPQIISVGVGYTGFENWTFAADVRHFAYGSTDGFKQRGFSDTGAVRGLGWESVFAAAVGVQYTPNDWSSIRIGYTFNESPISNQNSLFNIISPLVTQHQLGAGASFELSDRLTLSLTYLHLFQNSVSGPIETPQTGALDGTSVSNEVSADALAIGMTLAFDEKAK